MKFDAQTRCSLGEISEKPSWKLENMVSTIYKTISNISTVFSIAYKWDSYLQFFHHGWCVGRKSDHICQFKENFFFKDFGSGTFNNCIAFILYVFRSKKDYNRLVIVIECIPSHDKRRRQTRKYSKWSQTVTQHIDNVFFCHYLNGSFSD